MEKLTQEELNSLSSRARKQYEDKKSFKEDSNSVLSEITTENPNVEVVVKEEKQFNEAGYTDRFSHQSVENDNVGIFDVANPESLQKVNAFVGAIAEQEYVQPDAAMHQLAMKLGTIGLSYTIPKVEGKNGKSVVEVSQFGGRYGKTSDNTTSGDGDIENGDGISHRKEGGLKLEFNWEKQPNNTYKVFANLV